MLLRRRVASLKRWWHPVEVVVRHVQRRQIVRCGGRDVAKVGGCEAGHGGLRVRAHDPMAVVRHIFLGRWWCRVHACRDVGIMHTISMLVEVLLVKVVAITDVSISISRWA